MKAGVAAIVLIAVACGGKTPPPKRRVIESSVDAWNFRRYQQLVDVEVYVDDNEAVAHTASYARNAAEKRGELAADDVVNAFVTEYQRPEGIVPALVRFSRRLAQEGGYQVDEVKLGGARVIEVIGHGEAWARWGSGRFVVKIGGRGLARVPAKLVEAYAEPYPSTLKEGVLEGPLPELDAPAPSQEPYDPNNPTPDWDQGERTKRRRK